MCVNCRNNKFPSSSLRVTFIFIVLANLMGSQKTRADTDKKVSLKIWRRNMDFGNAENWDGNIDANCAKTIYSFDAWMPSSVISFPASVQAKQIILPNNGYLLFPSESGQTTFSDVSKDESSPSCTLKEVKFRRREPTEWFDPNNWLDSLDPFNEARGHVERVPCAYDSVKFPGNSSFSIVISSDVFMRKFYLGNTSLSYADIGLFMSSSLVNLQFKKSLETQFRIVDDGKCDENLESNTCICNNYKDSVKRHICSLVECDKSAEDTCPNPITPHGFCCPVCGYHLRLAYKTEFSMSDLKKKLNEELKRFQTTGKQRQIHYYATRYKKNGAHIVFIPSFSNYTASLFKSVQVIHKYLQQDSKVLEVILIKSWEHLDSDIDKDLSSSGLSGAVVSLIILLILLVSSALAFFIFKWNKTGYPPISSFCPPTCPTTCPTINIPSIPNPLGNSESRPSFAFARFANERISHLNLGQHAFGGGEGSLARTEAVDAEVNGVSSSSTTTGIENANAQKEKPSEAQSVGFSSDDLLGSPQDIMGKTDDQLDASTSKGKRQASKEEVEHVYDLIEVTEDSSSVLTSSTMDLLQKTEE